MDYCIETEQVVLAIEEVRLLAGVGIDNGRETESWKTEHYLTKLISIQTQCPSQSVPKVPLYETWC